MAAGSTLVMAGQVTRGSLSMTPSRASRASPQTAPAAVTTISNSAVCPCSASPEPSSASSPQKYPTRQNTSAYWPVKWLPGGATSRARPARKPVSTPAIGPPASASAATTSSTRSGPAPPGKAIRFTMVSWSTTVTATTTTEMTARTSVTARSRRGGGRRRGCSGGGGRGHGARWARRRGNGDRGGRPRQDRDPCAVPRHLHHYADHAEGGEADRRPYDRGLGERARVIAHRDDRADRHAGHLGLVAHRGIADDLLAGVQHGVRVEQAQPQHGRAGQGLARPGHRAYLTAARQLHSHYRRGVTSQQDGRGIRAHLGDQADETRAVEHGLVGLDAVVAAHVQRHRVGEAAAGRDDVGSHDPVTAGVELQ